MTTSAHEAGVAALLVGRPAAAVPLLRAAAAEASDARPVYAALAVALHQLGREDEAAAAVTMAQVRRRQPRRDRHHVAVIALVLGGQLARATALGREHVEEFPDDDLVRYVLDRYVERGSAASSSSRSDAAPRRNAAS